MVEYPFPGSAEAPYQGLVLLLLLLLLTITLDHDHERMKKLIRQSSGDIGEIARKGQAFLEQGPDELPERP